MTRNLHQPTLGQSSALLWTIVLACRIADGRGSPAFPESPPWPSGYAASLKSPTCASRARLKADRKSTRLNSSHLVISYAVFCLKKKNFFPNPPTFTKPKMKSVPKKMNLSETTFILPRDAATERERGVRVRIFFFFNDTATTEISTLSLHDALPTS